MGEEPALPWVATFPRQEALNCENEEIELSISKEAPCKRSVLSTLDCGQTWLSCLQFLLISPGLKDKPQARRKHLQISHSAKNFVPRNDYEPLKINSFKKSNEPIKDR